MVCFRYIIVEILHKGDNKYNNNNNYYFIGTNCMCRSLVIALKQTGMNNLMKYKTVLVFRLAVILSAI
jgi:hypothetical protein